MKDGMHAGRVELVTGAGRGIGAATARLLAGEGAAVALAARTEEEIVSVSKGISARGGTAVPVRVDVADEDSVSSCFETVRAELGELGPHSQRLQRRRQTPRRRNVSLRCLQGRPRPAHPSGKLRPASPGSAFRKASRDATTSAERDRLGQRYLVRGRTRPEPPKSRQAVEDGVPKAEGWSVPTSVGPKGRSVLTG